MLIRWVIGPAVVDIGASQLPWLRSSTAVIVCLTVISVVALWVLDRAARSSR